MNIFRAKKKSACVTVCALVISISLLPLKAEVSVAMPSVEPVLLGYDYIPVPAVKPDISAKLDDSSFFLLNTIAKIFFKGDALSTDQAYEGTSSYRPIQSVQAKLYSSIFAAQSSGDMAAANALLARVSDKRILGHALYQRYMHPTAYKANFKELKHWMSNYSDHPGAADIYKLAKLRRGNLSASIIEKPVTGRVLAQIIEPTIKYPKYYVSKIKRSNNDKKLVKSLYKKVKSMVRQGNISGALGYFKNAKYARDVMDVVDHDTLQTVIAAGYMYRGKLSAALSLAQQSADRSGEFVPDAAWVAGLVLWRKGDYNNAAKYFEIVGASPYASGWQSSAGYYWAARSYKQDSNSDFYKASLKNAAKHSHTFYGLLASDLLGKSPNFNWGVPKYSKVQERMLLSIKAGERAFALVASAQYDLAEAELMRLDYKGNVPLQSAALSYASHVGLPGLALRLGGRVKDASGKHYDSALYPISPWEPKDGYDIDPALVHAVMRQESQFNLEAKSHVGALGLMQIMPATAKYIAKKTGYSEDLNAGHVNDPSINIKLGQDYLNYLLKGRNVKGDIASLLIAYNAGPGNLQKWKKRMGDNDDMLLFIESLPVEETRNYVEHVLANYWIYRKRAGLETPTMSSISNGGTAKYAHALQNMGAYKLSAN